MAQPTRLSLLELPNGYQSNEVSSFIAQLDDQTRRLTEDTRGLTREALAWQPAPGMNTIGMLLAHIAIVEVYWTGLVLEGLERDQIRYHELIGIGSDDDGMPQPPAGKPPAVLAGRDLAYFDDLIARGRAQLKQVAAGLSDSDLVRTVHRVSMSGQPRELELRWTLYHLLEHFAGHYGQILLLKHHYGVRSKPKSRAKTRRAGAAGKKHAAGRRATASRRGAAKPRGPKRRSVAKPRGATKKRRR